MRHVMIMLLLVIMIAVVGCDTLQQQALYGGDPRTIADPDYISDCYSDSECAAGEICCLNIEDGSKYFTCEEGDDHELDCPEPGE